MGEPLGESYEGLGVIIRYDSLDRRSPENDNVMPVLHEEHYVTWKLLGESMVEAAARMDPSATVDFLEVGSGSGFWTVLVAKALQRRSPRSGSRLIAVDKVARMVDATKQNVRENLAESSTVEVRHEEYAPRSAPRQRVKVVFMNPPYHLYPADPEVEAAIPLHARGGPHGWEEFQHWLKVADGHLAEEGTLFFHHMCLGDAEEPYWQRFIPRLIRGVVQMTAHEILPRISTANFLQSVYGTKYASFVTQTSAQYPFLYFSSGMVVRRIGVQTSPVVRRYPVETAILSKRDWVDRERLHRAISQRI